MLQHSACSPDLVPQATVFWAFQRVFLVNMLQTLGVDIFAKGFHVLVSHKDRHFSVEMKFMLKEVCMSVPC